MKPKQIFVAFAFCIVTLGLLSALMGKRETDFVNYEESYKMDYNTGVKTYSVWVYHWKDNEIVRCEYIYGLTIKQLDSVKILEDKISEKYKNLK